MNNQPSRLAKGMFSFSLLAHLPYVHVVEGDTESMEQRLFDALTDTYLPLIGILGRLQKDRVPSRMTMAISPALLGMLEDPLLPGKYGQYLNNLEDEARPALARRIFFDECGGRLIERLRNLQDDGVLEIATCAATHSMLPLLKRREAMQAQVSVAVADYRRLFGCFPRGIWLPDCASVAFVDETLHELQLQYVLVDAPPGAVVRADACWPLRTPCGLAVYVRNEALSQSLWSEIDSERDDGSTSAKHAKKFATQLYEQFPQNPLLTAAYDAGLFRHRWAGGAEWLESVFRCLHRDRKLECAAYGELERLLPVPAMNSGSTDS
ncbi:MAG: glycoside hydrolase family protein, partial [Paenibacillaceae bacterium]|nr:glycoside hydrolase family protein [Paenibacillaceae bacterium]